MTRADWPGWIPPSVPARGLLLAGAALHLIFCVSLRTHWLDPFFLETMKAYGQAADFFGVHQAGRNLLDGLSIYDSVNYRGEAVSTAPYLYFYRYLPPTAYGSALGAAVFSPWTGYWIWVWVNELLLLWLGFSLWRWPGIPRPVRESLVGLTLGFAPFYLEQWMGQFSLAMACALWLTLRGEMRRSDGGPCGERSFRGLLRSSSFWGWTVSLALKSYSALFAIVYLLERRWRRVALAALFVGLAVLPYYAARPEDLLQFARLNLKPYPPTLLAVRYGPIAVVQLLSQRFLSGSGLTFDLGLKVVTAAELPVYLWIAFLGSVSLIVTLRSFRRARSEHLLILWMLTFFCVYKDIWEYHHVMLLPALYVFAIGHRSRTPWILFGWLALPTANVWAVDFWRGVPMETWSLFQVAVHHVFYAVPVGIFYLWTLRRCLEEGRGSRGERRPD